MKKIAFMFAVAAMFVACGNGRNEKDCIYVRSCSYVRSLW